MGDCINFGIIGCGAISEKHGQAMAQVEGARLIAVADVVGERARAFASKYLEKGTCGGQSRVYGDYRHMLADSDVDAVIVATPSGLHAQMGADALDAGKHVLIEKPIALTSHDAQMLIDKAQSVGRCLGTVHPNRQYPTSQMIYQAIRDGRLGRLSHGVATVRWNRRASYYDEAPWRRTRAMDGGILFNQAWHAFDTLLWYMGSPVVDVQAMVARQLHDVETEDVAVVNLRFENGALGLVEATTNVYPENLEHTVAVFGETGTVVQGGGRVDALKVWRVLGDDEASVLDRFSRLQTLGGAFAHGRVLQAFVEQVGNGVISSESVDGAIALVNLLQRIVG